MQCLQINWKYLDFISTGNTRQFLIFYTCFWHTELWSLYFINKDHSSSATFSLLTHVQLYTTKQSETKVEEVEQRISAVYVHVHLAAVKCAVLSWKCVFINSKGGDQKSYMSYGYPFQNLPTPYVYYTVFTTVLHCQDISFFPELSAFK